MYHRQSDKVNTIEFKLFGSRSVIYLPLANNSDQRKMIFPTCLCVIIGYLVFTKVRQKGTILIKSSPDSS